MKLNLVTDNFGAFKGIMGLSIKKRGGGTASIDKKREEECTKKGKSVVDCTTDYKSIQEGDRKKTENIDGQKKSSPECKKLWGKSNLI